MRYRKHSEDSAQSETPSMHGNSTRENRETLVAGFENRADAERFLQEWKDRLQKFGLELPPDKTAPD